MRSTDHSHLRPGDSPGQYSRKPPVAHPPPVITVFDYDAGHLAEVPDAGPEDIRRHLDSEQNAWVHVQGRPSVETLEMMAGIFGLHPLAVEDVANLRQRPKLDMYDHGCFVVMHLPLLSNGGAQLQQVSLFLGERYVLSFHEGDGEIWDPVRRRLRGDGSGRMRSRGSDYLLYALIDLIVDSTFPVLDRLDDRLEQLEETVLREPRREVLDDVHDVRRSLITLRRGLGPQRDMLNAMIRDEHPYIRESTKVYLRDCYDHMIRAHEALDSYRELVLGTQEIYMTNLGMRMNEVMKVLTIIATIFIPLSFITGLYGMNFNPGASPWNMPELNAYYGYPLLLGFLLLIVVGMLAYFRKKDWM